MVCGQNFNPRFDALLIILYIPIHTMSTKPLNYVLYDDQCPLCTFQMRVLTWMDWFNASSLLPISSPKAEEIASHLNRERLQEAIHCVAKNGKTYRGARCIRFIGLRLPLLIPLALFLWLPGVIWFAEKIYMWISRNRLLLSRLFGCKEACAILPPRKRSSDEGLGNSNDQA